MLKKTIISIMIMNTLLFPLISHADVTFKTKEQYVVKEGDTLWDISNKFLEKPWLWKTIWKENPNISDPNLIFPNDVLSVEHVGDKDLITLNRNSSLDEYTIDEHMNYVKKTPESESTDLGDAIPLIKYDKIKKYMSNNIVADIAEINKKGYIVKNPNGNLISGAGDDVFAYYEGVKTGDVFVIYNQVNEYKDGKDVLGNEVVKIGEGIITAVSSDNMGIMKILSSSSGIRDNYKLMMKTKEEKSNYFPSKPSKNIKGRIFSIGESINSVGLYDVVLINRGNDSNLEVGNLLNITSREEIINNPDPNRPDEKVTIPNRVLGMIMVYKVYNHLSYGIIVRATAPIKKDYLITNPE